MDIKDTIPRQWRSVAVRWWLPITLFLLLSLFPTQLVQAIVTSQDEEGGLKHKTLSVPALHPTTDLVRIDDVRDHLDDDVRTAWAVFSGKQSLQGAWDAHIDRRSGLVEIAEGAGVPWVPGYGNELKKADIASFLSGQPRLDADTLESIARSFLPRVAPLLGSEAYSLRLDREATGRVSGHLWFVEFDVYAGDLPIEGARVFFRVNNGNLVQFGAEKVPAPGTRVPGVRLSRDEALDELTSYAGLVAGRDWLIDKGSLVLLPVSSEELQTGYAFGRGYALLPVWELAFRRGDEHPTWRARVNAVTGEIVEFKDINRYSQVTGGYWPVSWKVDGTTVNQVSTGWPFTSVNPLGATSNTSGLYSWDGNPQTAYHTGPYVNIVDSCGGAPGTASSDAAGNIDFGTFNPPDTSTPGDCTYQLGISDNTPAARQQYWHVNKIKEKARSYYPANTWLQQQLGVNVNIDSTCNAFWNGVTLNFYRSNGGCYNLGANAGVSMHEWGHGMDSNDGNGSSLDNGTGETYGDFSAALQTLSSCVGNGIFTSGVCGGYGNPCVAGGCDGIRDIDWGRHASNTPLTVANFIQPTPVGVTTGSCSLGPGEVGCCPSDGGGGYNGPCGNGAPQPDDKEGHCESYVSSGALWDLAAADLQSGCSDRNALFPDYNCPTEGGGPYNSAGAFQTVDRLWYLSRPTANQAFTCYRTSPTWTSDGCNAGSNWKTFRAVDDDDGNLANGTPHSCQLAAAFDRHGISCTSDPAYDVCFRACPQPPAPTLSPVTPGNNQITLDWAPEPSPDVIDVFRNEIGCGSGFAKIANDVSGTLFVDDQVANGTAYFYQIVRHPAGNEACASPPSNCVSGTPAATPSARYVRNSAVLDSVPADNDGDGFVDNCETGRIRIGIGNDGLGALTNVRFTVTSPDPEVTITTGMPVVIGAMAEGTVTNGTFDFDLDGAACAQWMDFDISVTADEMAGSNLDTFSYGPVEQDVALTANRTDDFETGNDGWAFVQGYARENLTADSGAWSIHSSDGLDDQNDAAISPIFQKGAGTTQVVLASRHDIESPPWDRANVHAVKISDGSHTLLTPSGRTYTVAIWNPVGHVGTENGWAGLDETWSDAVFDLSGLTAGESYYLEVNHNTDAAVVGSGAAPFGHWFDNVRWTNVSFQVCDAQSDLCVPCTPPAAPTGLTASAIAANQITLSWSPVAPAPSQYRIYRSTAPGGPYGQVGSVGGGTLTFEDFGLTAGVTYYYVVRAFEICESADSNETSGTAFGDCSTPPTFNGLTSVSAIATGGSCALRLYWAAGSNNCNSAPLVYNVYRSTTSGFTPDSGNLLQSCVTDLSWDDTTLASGTNYYYVVQAEDPIVGNGGACRDGNADGNTSELSGVIGGSGPVILYSDDFDTGTPPYDNDWGLKLFSGDTLPATWRGIQTCTANSGARIFRFGGTGCTDNYGNNQFELAEPQSSTGIAVPVGATNVRLSFVHRRQFQSGRDGGSLWMSLDGTNYGFVNASAISGTTYNGTLGNTCPVNAGLVGLPIFTGADSSFSQTTVDLDVVCNQLSGGSTGCAGLTIWPGFMSLTDCTVGRDGWFLDDVEITAETPAACSPAPGAVQFLTATATDRQNVVEWLNPSGGGYGSTEVRWSTAGYPADPTAGARLVVQDDGLGGKGIFLHTGLTNGTTYYYSAFVDNGSGDYSARKTVSARPFDTSGNVKWAYSTGASALAPPGIGSVYGVANDRVLHSMETGGAGTWPSGWSPLAMNGPAQSRPPIVPIPLAGATKVAFVGSHDHRVYAVDAESGRTIWSSPDLNAMVQAAPAGIFAAFGGAYDLLLVGTRDASAGNAFHGLNLDNGSVAWTFSNTPAQGGDGLGIGIISGTASIDYSTPRAYFTSRQRSGGSDDTVWCVSFTGSGASLEWSRALGDIDASPVLFNGKLYVGTNTGAVYALDPATGADLWAAPFTTGDGAVKGYVWPRFGTNEILFSTTTRLWSVADNGANASLDWSVASIANPSVPLTSDVAGGSYAWVGSSDGRLYQLDISAVSPSITSVVLGSGAGGVGSPAMDAAAEIAYVGTEDGRVYAVTLPLP